ncbi:MAG: hypothetical protein KJ822_16975 [Proteobacteria bacterium]|nr:hypothetical protein [Pseudomonadota bacterium]
MKNLPVEDRVARDENNARSAQAQAANELHNFSHAKILTDFTMGITSTQKSKQDYDKKKKMSLRAIAAHPFHCMVEVEMETEKIPNIYKLLYANIHSKSNEILKGEYGPINVLSWTHPGIQLALTGDLDEFHNIKVHGLTLRSVKPLARAKFTRVLPQISGLYEPGGSIRQEEAIGPAKGLKAVKLDMTPEQVHAFISRMDGMMLVTGAPGSGKTTVAFQRIRFLFDQQGERSEEGARVEYLPELTKIFLANKNLLTYSHKFLVEDLQVSLQIVELVPEFIHQYLEEVWLYKHKARPRPRHISDLEQRAREAVFGLCPASDLRRCWRAYETQISTRLSEAHKADWAVSSRNGKLVELMQRLGESLVTVSKQPSRDDPLRSLVRMDSVFRMVRGDYEGLRDQMSLNDRDEFDEAFQQWLFWVYDPLNTLKEHFQENFYEAELRIKRGTAARIREHEVINSLRADWEKRQYGPEEEPWLAWLLRFALPEEPDPPNRFRQIPWALPLLEAKSDRRWTHVVIDEAQDLSTVEASLLSSLVHPYGALTISSDFRQIVSPVHGMTDLEAFKIGGSIKEQEVYQHFRFSKNMRQSTQISRFLQAFYEVAFGEVAPFEVGDQFEEIKPQLLLGPAAFFPNIIRQLVTVLRLSQKVESIALLQINEDEEALIRLRAALDREGVALAPIWEPSAEAGQLVTTSVERIKGLEYDACLVLGLDDVERASLNFTTNRAYVALSRPTHRLAMLCEEFPRLIQKVPRDLFEVKKFAFSSQSKEVK